MLPRLNRLTKETDFKEVARGARPTHSQYLILKKIAYPNKESKFGIVISAKISKKSTVRNKIRRRIGEVLRINLGKIKHGFKVMLVVKNTAIDRSYQEISQDLLLLLKKSGLL